MFTFITRNSPPPIIKHYLKKNDSDNILIDKQCHLCDDNIVRNKLISKQISPINVNNFNAIMNGFNKNTLKVNKRPPGLIAPPFTIGFLTTEKLPKVKLGQVEIGLNITQNHSSRLGSHILSLFAPNSYEKLTKCEIKSSRSWF